MLATVMQEVCVYKKLIIQIDQQSTLFFLLSWPAFPGGENGMI